jgi:hypothetical protein
MNKRDGAKRVEQLMNDGGSTGNVIAREIFVTYFFNNRDSEFCIQAGVRLFKQYKLSFSLQALRIW